MRFVRDGHGRWHEIELCATVPAGTLSTTVAPQLVRGQYGRYTTWLLSFDDPTALAGRSAAEAVESFLTEWSGVEWTSSQSPLMDPDAKSSGLWTPS